MLDRPLSMLAAGVFAVGVLAGACTATLDFTECREDSDCSKFFEDDKPMRCDNFQCVARDGCENNSQCAGLGEGYVCTVVGTCVQAASDQCAAPVYPDDEVSDDVVLIGSLVAKEGPDAALGEAAEKAIVQAVKDFNAATKLQSGKGVALVVCDTKGTKEGAKLAASHLGESLAVPAILGPLADLELSEVAQRVTLINGVRAFTHSPLAAAELEFPDSKLVWQTQIGVLYQARAIGAHLAAETADGVFGDPAAKPVTRMLFNQTDGYGYPMYYAIATEETDGEVNRIPEGGPQKITSYKSVADGTTKLADYVDGSTQVLILVGGAEVAELLAAYAATGSAWPTRVYIGTRSRAAVEKLGDLNDLSGALRLIGPDLGSEAALAVQARVGDTTPEVALAYDATMATLLAMAGIAEGSAVTGPNIVTNMARLNGAEGLAISFADDPKTFIKDAVDALAMDGDLQITGASGPLDYTVSDGTMCGDLAAFTYDGASFTLSQRFTTSCPDATGTWSE
jgi:hypothetical protein